MNVNLLKDAGRRAANTAWQTVATLTGAGQVDLFTLSWSHIGEAALGAAVLSVVKTFGVAGAVSGGTNVSVSETSVPSDEVDKSIEPGAR